MPRIEDQRRYYDRLWTAVAGNDLNPHASARLDQIRDAVRLAAEHRPPPWRVIDVGCGTGWLAAELSSLGEVTGVDLSEAGVAEARRRYPQAEFEARDIFAEGVPPGHDLVVSSEVLEHVEDHAAFIDLLVDGLAPGGHLLLTTPNGRVEPRWRRHPDYDPQPVEHWLEPNRLRSLLSARCEVIRLRTFFVDFDQRGVYRLVNGRKFRKALSRLRLRHRLEDVLGRFGLGLYTVACARRRGG